MGQVSRQDFADLCGIDMDSLRSYISRKKVIVHGDKGKFIDTTNPINKAFRDKRKSALDSKKEMQDIISRIPVNPRKGKPDADVDDDYDDNPMPESLSPEALLALFAGNKGGRQGKGDEDTESMQRYIRMKIKGDGELVAAKVIKENIQIDKLSGSLLPIDLVHNIQEVYCKTIFNSFENGCQNFASLICARLVNGDMTLYTQLVGELMGILQKCVDDAGRQADEDIDRLIDTFSVSRGRGEK
ncbi:hypothetical protein [Mucilaginibacter sp. NFR10]|uniref:hypothetical protein n=1 Tax=Mucilaginibacter sp. NFR10 TaxID=1566292 RepID=UPI0008718D91|nr:hypothetical protein [Mucilaginibacter sp. NFR10]SCW88374.1 hypothetical protein SAMN03159284_05379 [Mucilaginibacter sp. NFR10]